MYCYGFVLKSAFFLTLASLICIACSEYQILRSKLGKKRIGPGKKYHGQKSKHVGSEGHQFRERKANHFARKSGSRSVLSAYETDAILSIKNETAFMGEVIKLMEADDSDVLKNFDEDEQPFIGQQSKETSSTLQKSLISPGHARILNLTSNNFASKRSELHFMAFNSTMPDVAPSIPNAAYESMLLNTTMPSNAPGLQASMQLLKASRVCKPGPPFASNSRLPNCLIIGDSVALSYSYSVAAALQGRCIVQIAPFSKSGVALDSSYALQCLPLLLSTSNLTPTRFDAIIFNFGLHDINYLNIFPEEFNDERTYARNLGRIMKKLVSTAADVAFVTTTPIAFDENKNELVIEYNEIAKRVISKQPTVDTIDLYDYVLKQCGQPPFNDCFMMKQPNDVHYSLNGSVMLGKQVAAKFAQILKDRNMWVERGYSLADDAILSKPLIDMKNNSVKCSSKAFVPTRCPSKRTCLPNVVSRTGYGCCMLQNGVDCGDNWHCCPQNTVCHKKCTPTWCKCLAT